MDYYKVEHVITVVASFVVLHSLCEFYGDPIERQWIHSGCKTLSHTSTHTTNVHTTARNCTVKTFCYALKDYIFNNQ